ncbi:MAG TPA: hypothetical protein VGC67_06235 [Cellulomonas sp.]
MTAASWVPRVLAGGVLLGLLVGCGDGVPGPGASTSVSVPDRAGLTIVWPYGEPDDGTWSEHEAVRVMRRADMAIAIGRYTHDWSSDELVATVHLGLLLSLYRGDLSGGVEGTGASPEPVSRLTLGPVARVVVDVEVSESDAGRKRYRVTTCQAKDWQSSVDAGEDPRETSAYVRVALVVEDDDGELRMVSPHTDGAPDGDPDLGAQRCDLSKLRYGYFEPARQPDYSYLKSDVVAPVGWESLVEPSA